MSNDCTAIIASEAGGKGATQLPGLYLGAIIIISCAAGLVPLELFLVEIWSRHGFFSLLLIILPLVAGGLIVQSLPERYYRTQRFEASGCLYEWLGVRFFKRFPPNGDFINRINRRFNPAYRVVRDKASIVEFAAGTRLAEKCHLISLFLVLPAVAYALALGWNQFALWLVLPNIPLHFYPVLLQRYTRARIERVLKSREHGTW